MLQKQLMEKTKTIRELNEKISSNSTLTKIDEVQYKKELAMIRLGIIKVPALDIKISDYEK